MSSPVGKQASLGTARRHSASDVIRPGSGKARGRSNSATGGFQSMNVSNAADGDFKKVLTRLNTFHGASEGPVERLGSGGASANSSPKRMASRIVQQATFLDDRKRGSVADGDGIRRSSSAGAIGRSQTRGSMTSRGSNYGWRDGWWSNDGTKSRMSMRPSESNLGGPAEDGANSPGKRASARSGMSPRGRLITADTKETFGSVRKTRDFEQTPSEASTAASAPKNVIQDPYKWLKWCKKMDNKRLGAHYGPLNGDVRECEADPDKEDHDRMLCDTITKLRPEETPHPRINEPRPPAMAALTDRAVRLREGRQMKGALAHPDAGAATEWGTHGDCTCPVCRPEGCRPAGNASHQVHTNKAPRCWTDFAPGSEIDPTFVHWKNGVSPTHSSMQAAAGINHDPTCRFEGMDGDYLVKCLGRKIRDRSPDAVPGRMMKHRSLSADAAVSAGQYNQERYGVFPEHRRRGRQAYQGTQEIMHERSGVALVLDPRPEDPPAPTKITCSAKADGLFKNGSYSSDAARIAEHFNQEQFRYADARRVRGRSQPPPVRDSDMCGVPTGIVGNHMHNGGNPVTMSGVGARDTSAGAIGSLTPRRSFRSGMGNESYLVGTVINHDIISETFVAEKAYRMQAEPDFAARCATAGEAARIAHSLASSFKASAGHNTSSELKSHLQWPE